MNAVLKSKFKKIKLLLLDFDGVMTDGHVYLNQDGEETVRCSRKDGLGIEMLKMNNIEVKVISKETNPVVTHRCRKLKIDCWQNVNDSKEKFKIVSDVIEVAKILPEEVAYTGDDLNDLKVFGRVGVSITVADGHPKLKKIADFMTKSKGGEHAVREICEEILSAKGIELKF